MLLKKLRVLIIPTTTLPLLITLENVSVKYSQPPSETEPGCSPVEGVIDVMSVPPQAVGHEAADIIAVVAGVAAEAVVEAVVAGVTAEEGVMPEEAAAHDAIKCLSMALIYLTLSEPLPQMSGTDSVTMVVSRFSPCETAPPTSKLRLAVAEAAEA